MGYETARLALTFDDAPSMREPGPAAQFEPERMDRIREVLTSRGVRDAVAFVISDWAEGSEAQLSRWLAAGYELGNHTADHRFSSRSTFAEVMASIDRCHEYLDGVGAFEEGRQRWFRFPYLDRGQDPATRAELNEAIEKRGYRVASCSIDFFDYAYEAPFAEAERDADRATTRQILERYAQIANKTLQFQLKGARRVLGRDPAHSVLFHFSAATSRKLPDLLSEWEQGGASFCSLQEAVDDPLHQAFNADWERGGLFSPLRKDHRLVSRVRRRVFGALQESPALKQKALGPRWPHLS